MKKQVILWTLMILSAVQLVAQLPITPPNPWHCSICELRLHRM